MSNHSLLILKSTVRQHHTAIGHANRYVTTFKIQISTSQDASGGSCPVFASSFDEVPESSFEANCEFLGKFSCYLKDHVPTIKMMKTHLVLVSALFNTIVDKYPAKRFVMQTKYSALLDNIRKMYLEECALTGNDLAKNAVLMRDQDYEYIAMRMFEMGHHRERAMFVLDVYVTGRISEVSLKTIMDRYVIKNY